MISIHTTLAGGDDVGVNLTDIKLDFNPHHPRGWRPDMTALRDSGQIISIHTTLAGGD